MSRRVLMIAYYFPPLGGIGSLRAARFAEHLPEFGWEPTVIAPRLGTFHRDPELRFDERRVIRSRSIELSRGAKRALRVPEEGERSTERLRLRGAIRSLAHRHVYRPDPQIGWFPGALRAVSRALRDGGFDAIFSSSVPMTAHLVERRVRHSSGLPWVAEFRDPWSRSDDSAQGERLERSIAESATEVVMTSPSWATQHAAKWGRPVQAIVAGADPIAPGAPGDGLVVAHLGSFYPDLQDLSAAWAGLAGLRADRELPPLRLRFIGELPARVEAELERYGLLDVLEVTGFVPHRRALELVASSSILLAAGPREDDEKLRGWIPAKLLEYLATDRPIIYVSRTPNDGADLLREHPGCAVIPVGDAEAFAEAMADLAGKRFGRDTEALSWRARTAELASILDRATGGT